MTATVLGHTGYMPTLRADLHLHSSFSNKPTYWALRKFNCPESFTSPLRLYDIARSRAMDFVTITDHNSIDGCLEIAHLPRTFISSEITAHFPENGCKVHVVTLDLTASRFKEIMALKYSELVYYGLWYTPLREALDAFIDETQKNVQTPGETVPISR